MFQTFSKKQKILFILLMVTGILLAFGRISFEEQNRSYAFGIQDITLYRYYTIEKTSLTFQEYTEKLQEMGLNFIYAQPAPLSDFIKSHQASIIQADPETTVIKCSAALWKNNLLPFLPAELIISNHTAEASFSRYFQDILYLPFQYRKTPVINNSVIYLKEPFRKETIDGWYVDNQIFYSQEISPDIKKKGLSLFIPYSSIADSARIQYQYKRAFWERKNQLLLIPFFSKIIKQHHDFSLMQFVKETGQIIKNPKNRMSLPFQWYSTGLKIALIFLFGFFFFKNYIPALLFSFSAVLIDIVPYLNNIYMLMIILLSYFLFLMRLLNDKKIYIRDYVIFMLSIILLISGLGTSPDFLNKIFVPHFISLIFLFSVFLIFFALYKYRFLSSIQNIDLTDLLFFMLIPAVVYLFLHRSVNSAFVSAFESHFRDFLSRLFFIRPRLKEIFFFYPLLMFTSLAYQKHYLSDKTAVYLFSIGSLGFISSCNTILHFQTFFIFSFLRIILDAALGFLIGYTAYIFLKIIFYIRKVMNT